MEWLGGCFRDWHTAPASARLRARRPAVAGFAQEQADDDGKHRGHPEQAGAADRVGDHRGARGDAEQKHPDHRRQELRQQCDLGDHDRHRGGTADRHRLAQSDPVRPATHQRAVDERAERHHRDHRHGMPEIERRVVLEGGTWASYFILQ